MQRVSWTLMAAAVGLTLAAELAHDAHEWGAVGTLAAVMGFLAYEFWQWR